MVPSGWSRSCVDILKRAAIVGDHTQNSITQRSKSGLLVLLALWRRPRKRSPRVQCRVAKSEIWEMVAESISFPENNLLEHELIYNMQRYLFPFITVLSPARICSVQLHHLRADPDTWHLWFPLNHLHNRWWYSCPIFSFNAWCGDRLSHTVRSKAHQ